MTIGTKNAAATTAFSIGYSAGDFVVIDASDRTNSVSKILNINPNAGYYSGGMVTTDNSNLYISFMNNINGKMIVYGSGTSNVADVFHVWENTNTNPQEIWMGYNIASSYGMIQSMYNNISWSDTYINPNGGNLVTNGLKLSGTSATVLSNFTEYD